MEVTCSTVPWSTVVDRLGHMLWPR